MANTPVVDSVEAALERTGMPALERTEGSKFREALRRLGEEAALLDPIDRALLDAEAVKILTTLGHPRPAALVDAAVTVGLKAHAADGSDPITPSNGEPPTPFDQVDRALLDRMIEDHQAPVDAVPTPFSSVNHACRDEGGGVGLARGWHGIIAGPTGAGKSILGLNFAATALRGGEHIGFISLEMSQRQLVTRLWALTTGTGVRKLEPGAGFDAAVADTAATEFTDLCDRTGGCIYVNRQPMQRLSHIVDAIRREYETHGCRYFVTDYLQLAWTGSAGSLYENITEVSHAVRGIAAELQVVSIGLSQLNRATSTNRTEAPRPESLMGGSSLENDSDFVLLLDHSQMDRSAGGMRTKLLLAKNRHGPQLEVPIAFDYGSLQVREENTGTIEEERVAPVPTRGNAYEPEPML